MAASLSQSSSTNSVSELTDSGSAGEKGNVPQLTHKINVSMTLHVPMHESRVHPPTNDTCIVLKILLLPLPYLYVAPNNAPPVMFHWKYLLCMFSLKMMLPTLLLPHPLSFLHYILTLCVCMCMCVGDSVGPSPGEGSETSSQALHCLQQGHHMGHAAPSSSGLTTHCVYMYGQVFDMCFVESC